MKPWLRLEKNVERQWRDLYGFYPSLYEIGVWRKPLHFEKSSLQNAQEAASKSQTLWVGQDRFSPMDEKSTIDFFEIWRKTKKKPILIHDRGLTKSQSLKLPNLLSSVIGKNELFTFHQMQPRDFHKSILNFAKKKGAKILSLPSKGTLEELDERLFRTVQSIEVNRPVFVLTGSLRLANQKLLKTFPKHTFLLLQSSFLRWKLEKTNGWIHAGPKYFVQVETSPLWSLESWRAVDDQKWVLPEVERIAGFFLRFCHWIVESYGHKHFVAPKFILHPYSDQALRRLCTLSEKKPGLHRFLMQRLRRGESAVIPKESVVFLTSLQLGDVFEEAAHYVRLHSMKSIEKTEIRELVEEAFGFMVSRRIDPKRKVSSGEVDFEDRWAFLHQKAYRLGAKLAKRWKEDTKNRKRILFLWHESLKDDVNLHQIWDEMQKL